MGVHIVFLLYLSIQAIHESDSGKSVLGPCMARKLDSFEFASCALILRSDSGHNENEITRALDPFRFMLVAVAGWMNQRQLQVIDYLREENRVLLEQLGGRRPMTSVVV